MSAWVSTYPCTITTPLIITHFTETNIDHSLYIILALLSSSGVLGSLMAYRHVFESQMSCQLADLHVCELV